MSRKPDLIVPVRDRRQHKRYLTLKNFRNALIVVGVLFAVITIRSELRGPDGRDFGRLVRREMPAPLEQKPVEVVREAPSQAIPDETAADPMLIAPAAREQWLHDDATQQPTATMNIASVPLSDTGTRAVQSVATGETRVAIVGGPEGVGVVKQAKRAPVLSGGFGREQ